MAAALPADTAASTAPAEAKLSHFRDAANRDSDASDSDQSDASGRSLSPTRQGLSKTKKRKERRQFGAFADELGDLLGAAFQGKEEVKPAASTHAGTPAPPSTGQLFTRYLTLHAADDHLNGGLDGDLDGDSNMAVEPAAGGPKMSKRQRQNLAKMQARRLAKEQSKMVTAEEQAVAAERRGMTIQAYRGQRPDGKKGAKSDGQKRRSRKERERLRKKAEAADAMEVE
ncbi:hypothetical protein EKO04_009662 [Ascochyta lentis]|uniref:Uncharacterized protein n=1 Tax=Ascochyta lentis TaxID=205686 RepID=A0A8H7MBY8_9PLEO|nr:hypothetical protein EKO04_009662 [Ascochyta lentis]